MYFDTTLPMGLRSSPFLCQRVTKAFRYLCQKECFDIINYLDDLSSAEIWEKVEEEYSCFGLILSDCGVDEAKEKACTPNWLMIFLSILFNTRALTLEMTPCRYTGGDIRIVIRLVVQVFGIS